MYLVFIFISLTLFCPAAKCVNDKSNDKLIAYLVSNTRFFTEQSMRFFENFLEYTDWEPE